MKQSAFSGLAHIILSIVLGAILFYMLDPLITLMEKRQGVKRGVAIGVIFAVMLTVVVGVIVFAVPAVKYDVASFSNRMPEISKKTDEVTETLFNSMFGEGTKGGLRLHFEGLLAKAKGEVTETVNQIAENAATIYKNVASVFVDVVTGFIFAYYFIKDKVSIERKLLGIFPYKRQNDIIRVSREIGMIISSFIRGQFCVAIIVGIIETIGLSIIGLPAPWLFGIIGGVSNLIPYIGPVIGAIPAAFAAILISPWRGIFTVLLFVFVQQLDNNLISPKIIENRLGVHPVVSIIAIFIGGELWGLTGILIAIPLYAVLRCLIGFVIKEFINRRTVIKKVDKS